MENKEIAKVLYHVYDLINVSIKDLDAIHDDDVDRSVWLTQQHAYEANKQARKEVYELIHSLKNDTPEEISDSIV